MHQPLYKQPVSKRPAPKQKDFRRRSQPWLPVLLFTSLLGFFSIGHSAALAEAGELTQAEVYRIQNIVRLLLRNQSPRTASVEDILAPRDALETGNRSRAELVFNEGSLARLGSNTVFRFVPGLRRYQLPDGSLRSERVLQMQSGVAVVAAAPSGFGGGDDTADTTIEDENLQVRILASTYGSPEGTNALMFISNPGANQSQIIALTNDIWVFDPRGQVAPILLEGGQSITVIDGVFGLVETIDLALLLRTSSLTTGMGPSQPQAIAGEPERVQQTLQAVQQGTLRAIARQQGLIQGTENDPQGLCTVNARGISSTEQANCITTPTADPLSDFENQREDLFEPRDEIEPEQPVPGPNDNPEPASPNDPQTPSGAGPFTPNSPPNTPPSPNGPI